MMANGKDNITQAPSTTTIIIWKDSISHPSGAIGSNELHCKVLEVG